MPSRLLWARACFVRMSSQKARLRLVSTQVGGDLSMSGLDLSSPSEPALNTRSRGRRNAVMYEWLHD